MAGNRGRPLGPEHGTRKAAGPSALCPQDRVCCPEPEQARNSLHGGGGNLRMELLPFDPELGTQVSCGRPWAPWIRKTTGVPCQVFMRQQKANGL